MPERGRSKMDPNFKQADDKLDRKAYIKTAEKYVEINSKRNEGVSVSLAINSKWGSGKTCFISMWKEYIESTHENDITIYYNAWENDDCDSAILPLLYHIISTKTNETKDEETYKEYVMFFLKQLALNTVKFGVNKFFLGDPKIGEVINESLQKTVDKDHVENIFVEFDDYYGKRKQLQETLKSLIPLNGKLWIFVDDLDRCNPVFAINTLECIKHFFDLENINFIFAIDFEHIVVSVERIYGSNIDASSYVKKFFNSIYDLPAPIIECYVSAKLQDFDEDSRKVLNPEDIISLFEFFNYSLRDMDLTLMHLELFMQLHGKQLQPNASEDITTYLYFLCLKDKFNRLYSDIIHGRFSMEEGSEWRCLNESIIYNDVIRDLLKKISKKSAEKPSFDLFQKYRLIKYSEYNSFAEHMEYVLC